MSCTVYLYTDGACKGNPGPGGWGYLLKCGENSIQDSGSEKTLQIIVWNLWRLLMACLSLTDFVM